MTYQEALLLWLIRAYRLAQRQHALEEKIQHGMSLEDAMKECEKPE